MIASLHSPVEYSNFEVSVQAFTFLESLFAILSIERVATPSTTVVMMAAPDPFGSIILFPTSVVLNPPPASSKSFPSIDKVAVMLAEAAGVGITTPLCGVIVMSALLCCTVENAVL